MDLEQAAGLASVKGLSDSELDAAIEGPSKTKTGKEKIAKLLLAAEAYLQKEEATDAVQAAKQALEAIKAEKGDKESEAVAQLILSKAQAAAGNFQGVFQATNQAAKLFKELGSKKGDAATLLVAAKGCYAKQCFEDAGWKATESRKLFKQLVDKTGEGCALEVVAKSLCEQQDFKKGMDVAKEALDLSAGDGLKEASRLCIMAKLHAGLGEVQDALEVGKQALAKFHDVGEKAQAVDAIDVIVDALAKKENESAASNTIQLEADLMKREGCKKLEAKMVLKKAELSLLVKEPDQGFSAARDAEELSKAISDKKGEGEAICMHAKLRLAAGEAGEALKLSQNACAAFKDAGKKGVDGFIAAFDVVMAAVAKTGSVEEAFTTAREAMKSFSVQREKKGEAAMLMSMGELLFGQGSVDAAMESVARAPSLFAAAGDKRREAAAWTKIAQLHAAKREAGMSLRAAEEAKLAYRKLGDRVGKAAICQLIADAQFALVPRGQGNGREAMLAAQEAMEDYKVLGDRHGEVSSMHLLANAQLMMQAVSEAMRTASKAQQICRDLGDQRGQGSAMLLVAGAHLADGDFAEAKTMAKDAKEIFKEAEDIGGEDAVDDFLDSLKKYESGSLNRFDFMGFSMSAADEPQGPSDRPQKKKAPLPGDTIDNNVNEDDFVLAGKQTEKYLAVDYDGIEVRAAGQEASRAAARRGKKQVELMEEVRKEKEAVTYAIRWVPAGEDDLIKVPKDVLSVEDRRINFSMALGSPYPGFGGQFGKTERMFKGMGEQKFV